MKRLLAAALAALLLSLGSLGHAQGQPTASVSGRVVDDQGLPLPGVAVTATSPVLQGSRSATTSGNGDYIVPFLPPGEYLVEYALAGFQKRAEKVRAAAGQTAVRVDVSLKIDAMTETVEVTANAGGSFDRSAAVSTTYSVELVNNLPIGRTPLAAALLAPGTNNNGPSNNMTINGAPSFQNLFVVDGVVAQDNLRNTPANLFIEDAIQETGTTTASISAEYGRFGGGIVNAVTKSGGNTFSGSYRSTLNNDKWTALTPFPNDRRTDKLDVIHEMTFGGPILRDKLWFFASGRHRKQDGTAQTRGTNITYDTGDKESRAQLKLTYSPNAKHTFRISGLEGRRTLKNSSFLSVMDLASLYDEKLPQSFASVGYTAVLRPNFFIEAQASRKGFTFENSGSKSTDPISGTLLVDGITGFRYNAATFCGVCTNEERNNENYIIKGNYFASTSSLGSHNIVGGVDIFRDKRLSNNHQSGSDYRIFTSDTIIRGTDLFPVFDENSFIRYQPILQESLGNDFRTYSAFLNDVWQVNRRLSLSLGVRFDKNDGKDAGGVVVVKDSAISPRASLTFDPTASGDWTLNAGFAKYVTAIANSVADGATAGGQPARTDWDYGGPGINTNRTGALVPASEGIRQVFAWLAANGGTSRPGDGTVSIPGLTARIDGTLASPHTREMTLGVSRRLGSRGLVRLDGVLRELRDFYASSTTPGDRVTNPGDGRLLDIITTRNTNELERKYKGLLLQWTYAVKPQLSFAGNYTLSRLRGNFVGETAGSGPVTSGNLYYPEYFDASWSLPVGDLSSDQRHKLRAWVDWQLPTPSIVGSVNLGVLHQYNSGSPYGASGGVDTRFFRSVAGYSGVPTAFTYWFTARDAFHTDANHRTDLALNWSRKIGLRGSEIFFRGTVQNVANNQAVVVVGTGVADRTTTTRLRRFDPFVTTPVEGVDWEKAATFGRPTSRDAYQLPRTYAFSLGIRF